MKEPIFNLEKWLSPQICTPDYWFRYCLIGLLCVIGIIYLMHSNTMFFGDAGKDLGKKIGKPFRYYNGYVFGLCGLDYLVFSASFYNQYAKIVLLIILPLLIFVHLKLFKHSKKIHKRVKSLHRIEDVELYKTKNQILEKKCADLDFQLAKTVLGASKIIQKAHSNREIKDSDVEFLNTVKYGSDR